MSHAASAADIANSTRWTLSLSTLYIECLSADDLDVRLTTLNTESVPVCATQSSGANHAGVPQLYARAARVRFCEASGGCLWRCGMGISMSRVEVVGAGSVVAIWLCASSPSPMDFASLSPQYLHLPFHICSVKLFIIMVANIPFLLTNLRLYSSLLYKSAMVYAIRSAPTAASAPSSAPSASRAQASGGSQSGSIFCQSDLPWPVP